MRNRFADVLCCFFDFRKIVLTDSCQRLVDGAQVQPFIDFKDFFNDGIHIAPAAAAFFDDGIDFMLNNLSALGLSLRYQGIHFEEQLRHSGVRAADSAGCADRAQP